MKDQYVGDINDFFKYQLLRMAAGIFDPLIVAWMLTEADGRTDGGRISYLRDPDFRNLDPELFDALATIVASGKRSVSAVQQSGILASCDFELALIPTDPDDRAEYFRRVAERAEPGSLVFFDPDNGLEVPSTPRHRSGAHRYLYWDELRPLAGGGASAAIYQHFPRVNRPLYVKSLLHRLGDEMGDDYITCAAYTSQVAYLFAVCGGQGAPLQSALAECCAKTPALSFAAP